ncbi:MAG: hydroxymethylglutaryl-CoA synthase [Candidatus Thermoplasmatota archaeon]|nr:hydroxymethylglutaryl-CoA synthase [Candidatus Thermoplasmatota archaeon]
MEKSGIVGYGAYVPRYRIKADEIARVWGKTGKIISAGLNIYEKSVPSIDEDTATISVEAARRAVASSRIDPKDIGAVYVGSESHPYAVKPTATIVGEAIGATPDMTAADYEFACKAGTAAIQTCLALVKAGMIKYGTAVGADVSQAAPGDALEYAASAGGAAYIIGKDNLIAEINENVSYTTDTPDFWRREGEPYPGHGERFTGEPAYFRHVIACTKKLMDKVGTNPSDYDYAIFHQPNGKFPRRAAKKLGFLEEQIEEGLLCPIIGNTYSGSTPLGLSAVLDVAKPGDRILATSYGSGAGSDSFDITVTEKIKNYPRNKIREMIDNKVYVDYAIYMRYRGEFR